MPASSTGPAAADDAGAASTAEGDPPVGPAEGATASAVTVKSADPVAPRSVRCPAAWSSGAVSWSRKVNPSDSPGRSTLLSWHRYCPVSVPVTTAQATGAATTRTPAGSWTFNPALPGSAGAVRSPVSRTAKAVDTVSPPSR